MSNSYALRRATNLQGCLLNSLQPVVKAEGGMCKQSLLRWKGIIPRKQSQAEATALKSTSLPQESLSATHILLPLNYTLQELRRTKLSDIWKEDAYWLSRKCTVLQKKKLGGLEHRAHSLYKCSSANIYWMNELSKWMTGPQVRESWGRQPWTRGTLTIITTVPTALCSSHVAHIKIGKSQECVWAWNPLPPFRFHSFENLRDLEADEVSQRKTN